MKKKRRILVVEDDRTTRRIIVHILESAGYEVVDSGEGKDALHIASMCPPDTMLVDVMLPDMQGTSLVEEILSHEDCQHVVPLFLTGLLSKKTEQRDFFFDIKGRRFRALPKPIRKDHLLHAVGEVSEKADQAKRSIEEAKEAAAKAPKPRNRPRHLGPSDILKEEQQTGDEIQAENGSDYMSPLW